MRTPEELERLAYISGDTKIAALIAEAVESDEEIDRLQQENDCLQIRIEDLEYQLRKLKS